MPKPLTVTVSYSIGISRNVGAREKFSNAKVYLEEAETWDVSDLPDETAVELLASSIHGRLREKLDKRAEDQYERWGG